MINQRYRLIDTKNIRIDFVEEEISEDKVIVKPTYMSICAADQRYYQGLRPRHIMQKKLPLSLIHEAVGEVLYDPKGEFTTGTKVVLIPNDPKESNSVVKENYLRSSKFMGSSEDGFMQGVVVINRENLVDIDGVKPTTASLLELISVSMNAIENFEKINNTKKDVIGVWGDGSVGYVTSLVLKYIYPKSKIIVLGKKLQKLDFFSFADEIYTVDSLPTDLVIDQAFECVGGSHSDLAINQIIDVIAPQGTISLLGVSEENVPINTRMVLEKGLTFVGNSRSGRQDFINAINLLRENPEISVYLEAVISDNIKVTSVNDIHTAFSKDMDNEFKTVMEWLI